MIQKQYSFSTEIWLYPGMAGWHFLTLPTDVADNINYYYSHLKKGWGSLPVRATIGQTSWNTSIFPDKKANSYLMPLKAEVRKKETLNAGDTISIQIAIRAS